MKKISFMCILLMHITGILFAQKKTLDNTAYLTWPHIWSPVISTDGKYVAYRISSAKNGSQLILQATGGSWKREIRGCDGAVFTADSRNVIFKNQGDSISIVELGTDKIRYIPNVSSNFSYKVLSPNNGKWLIYLRNGVGKNLIVHNLVTGEEKKLPNIEQPFFNRNDHVMVLKQIIRTGNSPQIAVLWFDFATSDVKVICKAEQATQFTFNKDGDVLAFIANNKAGGKNISTLHYYRPGMDSSRSVIIPTTSGMNGMIISEKAIPFFSNDGKRLFFGLIKPDTTIKLKHLIAGAALTVQGINDDTLKADEGKKSPFQAVVDLNSPKSTVLILNDQVVQSFDMSPDGNYFLAQSKIIGDRNDYKWKLTVRPDIYLISTKDGSRRLLKKQAIFDDLSFSPLGKYVTWFDREMAQWFAYNVNSGKTSNISSVIKFPVYREDERPDFPKSVGSIAGWLNNDQVILIYDRHDLWKLDPEGIKPPVNLTGGYGLKNKMIFRALNFDPHPIVLYDTLLLSAFDQENKENGFYSLALANKSLKKLALASYCYIGGQSDLGGDTASGPIIKAKNAKVFVVIRMSATEYPNLYITSDFISFKALTDLSPQKTYNWYTSELAHWKLPDGKTGEGILYKPESFDPHKKYPIIFYYYEQNSSALNTFLSPALSEGRMNIPWFVSNGYLVFVPDIHYKIGHPGQSAYDAVVSAAQYLSQKPWVDATRMGLQGHSFGGQETNYIVSHTSLFAAASPAAAVSNNISGYGEFESGIWLNERTSERIGATIWQRPDLYIENSAVFKADKVTTPILIMHTKQDAVVAYSQGLQWYHDLRRLGKKVWFLSYDGESHTLSKKENQLDYSIRLGQFFNYYLKGALPPKWMTQGVDKSKIGTEDDLGLDSSGRKP